MSASTSRRPQADLKPTSRRPHVGLTPTPPKRSSPAHAHDFHTHTRHPKMYYFASENISTGDQQGICQYKIIIKALCAFLYKNAENGHFWVTKNPHLRAATRTRTRTRATATRTRTRTRAQTWKLKFSFHKKATTLNVDPATPRHTAHNTHSELARRNARSD